MVVQAMAVFCRKHSYVYPSETHFDEIWGRTLQLTNFVIAVNDPNCAKCDSVVREAIGLYWGRNTCHLFKVKAFEELSSDSTVLKRSKASSHLPIMN